MAPQKMTSRERILAALQRREVDYVPCSACFNPLTLPQRKGYKWQFPWAADSTLADELDYQVRELGLDQLVPVGIGLCRPAKGVTSKTWLEQQILHKVFSTPAGELHAAVSYNELWPHGEHIPLYSDFNIGHFVEPWIKNEADLACLKHVVRFDDTRTALVDARSVFARTRALADRYQLATAAEVGMGLTGAQHLFGVTGLLTKVLDQPGLVQDYLEHEHSINLRLIEVLGELGVDVISRNGFYETADFYSPAMLNEFVGERIRREAAATRSAGMLASYTIHTGIMPILDYLATLNVDSFFGIDIAFQNIDLGLVRAKLSPGKSLRIGPSSTFHLWKGPEATRAAVRLCFEIFGKTGLILSPCVSAHSIMPWESTLAMIAEWKKLR
ncbi:MAG: hypothetical protein HYV36_01155 [Lentisphaerae bacterium]|nr:hypothetical protein [Lentisphaerota bacterium]